VRALPAIVVRKSLMLGCTLAWLLLPGCYHYRVTAPDTARATEPRSEVLWSLFWGLSQQNIDTRASCQGNPVAEVHTSTNLGFSLLTLATLGIVAPLTVEWVCAADSQSGGDDF
jgi:hypothetical protein